MKNYWTGLPVNANQKFPNATRSDHANFCKIEKWTLVRGATGKQVTHHLTYELSLWDGRFLRTRISRPVNRDGYAKRTWQHILKTQLEVTEGEFWECVRDGLLPNRGGPVVSRPSKGVPLFLILELSKLGVSEAEIRELDAPSAAALYAKLLETNS